MVKPFSHKNYHRNQERCTGDDVPCVVCGLPIQNAETCKWVHVGAGGDCFYTEGEARENENDGGYMGVFPVGPGCYRKHKKQFDRYIL